MATHKERRRQMPSQPGLPSHEPNGATSTLPVSPDGAGLPSHPDTPSPIPEAEFIWHFLLHENDHLTNRVNFFLVAESMLVTAYATLVAAEHRNTVAPAQIVAVAGILVAVMWWHVSNRALKKTIFPLQAKARALLPSYAEIYRLRGKSWLSTHRLIALNLPWIIVLMWLGFIVVGVLEPLRQFPANSSGAIPTPGQPAQPSRYDSTPSLTTTNALGHGSMTAPNQQDRSKLRAKPPARRQR